MSLLEWFKDNKSLWDKFNGNVGGFKYPKDITDIMGILMEKINDLYLSRCNELNTNPKDIFDYVIEYDNLSNPYLIVTGSDKRTKLIIIKDDIKNYEYYKNIMGKKIIESSFKDILDLYQKEKLKKYGIAKRLLKDNPSDIDLIEEFNLNGLKEYYEYLIDLDNSVKKVSVNFIEPVNIGSVKGPITNSSKERKSEVLSYDLRRQCLISRKPMYIINLVGNNKGEYDAYVYQKDNFTYALVEPINGTSYTYILNLGEHSYLTEEMIINNIRSAMEANLDVVLSDNAIIRKKHSTIDSFNNNLDTLLNDLKSDYRLRSDIDKSNEVYGKSK